jgi:hypothetical protein
LEMDWDSAGQSRYPPIRRTPRGRVLLGWTFVAGCSATSALVARWHLAGPAGCRVRRHNAPLWMSRSIISGKRFLHHSLPSPLRVDAGATDCQRTNATTVGMAAKMPTTSRFSGVEAATRLQRRDQPTSPPVTCDLRSVIRTGNWNALLLRRRSHLQPFPVSRRQRLVSHL